jgi:D5 N terminal like
MSKDLSDFLQKHKYDKSTSNNPITHTRIGDKDSNIYGGCYHILGDALTEFYKHYVKEVIRGGKKEYLTEVQNKQCNGQMMVDLDFRYTHDVDCRQHNANLIEEIVCQYMETLKKVYEFNNQTTITIMCYEKPNVNRLADGSMTKDGIHLSIGMSVNYEVQTWVRQEMMEWWDSINELPLINDTNSVFDEGISKGTCNWQLYGSRKPNNEAYQLTHLWGVTYDANDGELMFAKHEDIDAFDYETNFELLTARYTENPILSLRSGFATKMNAKVKQQIKDLQPKVVTDSEEETPKSTSASPPYLSLLKVIGTKGHSGGEWRLIVAWCKKWITKSQYLEWIDSNWRSIAEEKWNDIDFDIYEHWLEKFAKSKNEDGYKQWRVIHKRYLKVATLNKGANDVAIWIAPYLKNQLVFCSGEWYYNNPTSGFWGEVSEPSAIISTFIQREIDKSRETLLSVKNRSTTTEEMRKKFEKLDSDYYYHYKVVCSSSFHSILVKYLKFYLCDEEFKNNLDNGLYKMVFKNGIMDLKTMIFKDQIQNEDYMTTCIPHKYEEPSITDIEWVKTQLKKICNWNDSHLEYYLSVLGYALTSDSSKEQMFAYLRGQTASNGKSKIFEILSNIMPNYCRSTTLEFMDKGEDIGKLVNTWRGLKILWVNEVSTKKKNEDLVKAIADGTSYTYKMLYAKSAKIMPIKFKLFAVSNNSLNIKGDAGIKRRFKLCQFNSQFKQEYTEDNYEKLQFQLDKDLGEKIEGKYRNAFIHLLMIYGNKYFKDQKLATYPAEWKEEADENMESTNKFDAWFEETFELGGQITKKEVLELMSTEFKHANIKDELTRMKIPHKYNSQDYMMVYGKKIKGVFTGFQRKNESILPESI